MLRRLQIKIIWINVLLCGVLLFGIFSAVCANSYRTARAELEAGLRVVVERSRFSSSSHRFPMPDDSPKQGWMLDAYTVVFIAPDGSILTRTDQNMSLTDAALTQAISFALESGESAGICRRQPLMFALRASHAGTRIAFAGTASITRAVLSNIAVSAILFLAAVAIVMLISFGLSVLAVRPVKTAWNKQKQFIADASHELKTPLTVILANTDILLSHTEETVASQKQWIVSTDEEAKTMRRMVEQMLELARSDADETAAVSAEVDLSALAEGCALCLEPTAYEKNMRIDCDIEPGIVIQSDGERLTQLCRILLDNAVKYGARDTAIRLELHTEGRRIILRVHNSGTPIPPEDLPHIFDRFYRTDKARSAGGFGLGLAIAKSTVQALGGEISAVSDAENGTVFTVVLPK